MTAEFQVRSSSLARRGLGRALGWLAALALVLPWVPAVASVALGSEPLGGWVVGVVAGWALAPILAVAAPIVSSVGSRQPANLRVEPDALVITQRSRARRVQRSRIEGGVLVPGAPPRVELYLSGGDVLRVVMDDQATAESFLDALDLGARERRVRVELAEPWRRAALALVRVAVVALFWFLVLGWGVGAYERSYAEKLPFIFMGPWMACIVGTIAAWSWLRRAPSVVVGDDAVVVERGVGTTRHAYTDLAAAWAEGRSLWLRDHEGRVTEVSGGLGLPGPTAQGSTDTLRAVADRIMAARARAAGARPTAELGARLDRAGRTISEWREGLAALLDPTTSYRRQAVGPHEVASVLEDGAASPERRIGAALALVATGEPGARERVRVAAGLTAGEALRAARERAAEQEADDEALGRAVEAAARAGSD